MKLRRRLPLLGFCAALALLGGLAAAATGSLQAGRGRSPAIPACGQLAGRPVRTTVDSEYAREYLDQLPQRETSDPSFGRELEAVRRGLETDGMDGALLQHLSKRYSPDFATLVFAEYTSTQPANRRAQDAYLRELDAVRRTGEANALADLPEASAYLVLFAPGWLYRSHPESGADLAAERDLLSRAGIESRLIGTEESASVESNAEVMADAIRSHRHSERKLILVSVSKSGPEVALALGKLLQPEESARVEAWINIGGVIRGTPLADAALAFPRRLVARLLVWINGWDFAAVESMATVPRKAAFRELRIPARTKSCRERTISPRSDNLREPLAARLGPSGAVPLPRPPAARKHFRVARSPLVRAVWDKFQQRFPL